MVIYLFVISMAGPASWTANFRLTMSASSSINDFKSLASLIAFERASRLPWY